MKPYKFIFHIGRKKAYWLLLPLLALVCGCRKFVTVPPPTTELSTATVFNNNVSSTQAVLYIYTEIWSNLSAQISELAGMQSDELTSFSASTAVAPYYHNSMTASQTSGPFGQWQLFYKYIYQANVVIQGLQQYNGTDAVVKKQLSGEAYFIRAFCYFYLSNEYGAVPLALTPNYASNASLARTPRLQVLQQVISDLQQAETLLNTNYIDGSDTTITQDRVRPNKAVAAALLARAYLYYGDFNGKDQPSYHNAEAAATVVISNSKYSLGALSGTNSPFLIDNTEAIWQIATPGPTPSTDTEDGTYFILTGAPSTGQIRCTTISPELLASFEPGDQRKINWIGSYTSATNATYYFPYKYKNRTSVGTEYTTVLRLGEQFLIRAEARAEQNNIIGPKGALADLDTIRNRAGLPDYAGAKDQASVLAAILHERQIELFAEWGHRWFDLIRTGNANAIMGGAGGACAAKGGAWNPDGYQQLYPVPYSEILYDPNLSQNPGY